MNTSILERFNRNYEQVTESGCWIWTGATNGRYPKINVKYWPKTVNKLAHRLAYELFKGPIPNNYEIDHKCFVKLCVNPDHLEAVTRKVNHDRAKAAGRSNGHCLQINPPCGHNYDAINSRGYRQCLTCKRAKDREWKRNNRKTVIV